MRTWLSSATIALLIGLVLPAEAATVDRTLNIQGMVATSGGVPVADDAYDMKFRLFVDETGGTKLWEQVKTGVLVTDGVFDVALGPMIVGHLEDNDELWVETEVEGTILPRVPLRAVAYALVAQLANDLNCSGCVAGADVADGGIGPAKLASGTYGINISGNAATATSATAALSATSFTGALGGDVTGNQGSTKVTKVQGVAVSTATPSGGQVLQYNAGSSKWEPAAPSSGSVTVVNAGAGLTGGPITSSGTLSIANNGVTPGMVSSGSYGISISGNAATATTSASFSGALAGDVQGTQGSTAVAKIRGVGVSTTTPSNGQVLKYNSGASQWEPSSDSTGSGTVTSVGTAAGLTGGTITSTGTIGLRLNGSGGLSATLGGGSNELGVKADGITPGMVSSGTYGINISGNAATATAATSATSFSGALGGDVTGGQSATTVGKIRGVPVAGTTPSSGQVLKFNSGTGQWEPGADSAGTGTVNTVNTGAGLEGGPITNTGTISIKNGGVTSAMVAAGTYGISISGNAATASTATNFSGALAGDVAGTQGATSVQKLRGVALSTTSPANGQVLKYDSGTGQWGPAADSGSSGTVTSVATGKGLIGGTITSSGTLSVRLNTAGGLSDSLGGGTNELGIKPGGVTPGMVAGGTYGISISGSAASAATASTAGNFSGALAGDVTGTQSATTVARIRGRNVSTAAPGNGQVLKYNSGTGQWEPDSDATGAGIASVTASSPLASSGGTAPNISLGTVPTSKGGTGLTTAPTGAGQFMRSTGSGSWGISGLAAGDVPGGSGSYIWNGTGTQSANFNVSGQGTVGGIMYANASMRSPIFYDLNNTGYYMDPASNSQVSSIYANAWFRAQGQTGFLFQDYGGGFYMTDSTWVRVYNGKALIADGEIRSGSNVRAPIFYDLNDGAYYTDPNGTSRMNVLYPNTISCMNGYCPSNGVARLTPNLHLNSLAGYALILNWDNGTTGSAQTLRIGNGQGSDVFYVRADGLAYGVQFRDINNGSYYLDPASTSILNDVRATIFYDQNDTGYYVNPNGTSQLSYVLANNWFRAQGTSGFYFESYGGGWHMTDSTWIRAYNGKGVYVAAEIQSGTNVRAPIMYDLNDGGFYMDPNGTSRLQHTRQDGRVYYDGGCPAPFTHYGGYHSYAGYSNKICMWRYGANTFPEMQNVCFAMGGHVCSYSDIYAVARVYGTSPAGIGIGNGWWIGNFYGDDAVFCVNNQGDRNNFEGGCNKNNVRYAACCYTSTHNE